LNKDLIAKLEFGPCANGAIAQPRQAGSQLLGRLRDAVDLMDCVGASSFVGATAASFLLRWPWLASMELSLSVTWEYDDQGGTYRSVYLNVRDVVTQANLPIPESFQNGDGVLDEDLVGEKVEEILENELFELHHGATGDPRSTEDATILVCRESLSALLAADGKEVSGLSCFNVMFPQHGECLQKDWTQCEGLLTSLMAFEPAEVGAQQEHQAAALEEACAS
jgi:hypothetical protein